MECWQSSASLVLFVAVLNVPPLLTLGFTRELRICPLGAVMSAGPRAAFPPRQEAGTPSADEDSVAGDEAEKGESGGELKVDESSVERSGEEAWAISTGGSVGLIFSSSSDESSSESSTASLRWLVLASCSTREFDLVDIVVSLPNSDWIDASASCDSIGGVPVPF